MVGFGCGMDYSVLVCSSFFFVSLHAGDQCTVRVQYYGGLLPDIILLTQCYGNTFECHGDVLSLQPMILPKRFDIFPPV